MSCRTLIATSLASAASVAALLILAPPSAAQTGRDLLVPAGAKPQARVGVVSSRLSERAGELPVSVRIRDPRSARHGAVGVSRPATEVYKYDDDSFEAFLWLVDEATDEPLYEMEFAQRFQLRAAGTVEYAEVCFARSQDDTTPEVDFAFRLYSNAGGSPGDELAAYDVSTRLEEPGFYDCFLLADELVGQSLPAGNVWVAVSWRRGTAANDTKLLPMDSDNSGGRRAFRARSAQDAEWEAWQIDTESGPYGIRLAVDHPDPDPDPEPDPDPPPDPDPTPDPTPDPDPDDGPPTGPGYTDCVPETSPLVFDGGYSVRMCYETAQGTVGEAKAGIWASGESGLLWFFTRDNAEVLVKVLDGCAINNHRWVYVAPVTDLAFNLYVVDSEGTNWAHYNRLGDTASTRSDNEAFPCSN